MWRQLSTGRGYIDDMARVDDDLHVYGWLLNPNSPADTIELVVDGKTIASQQPSLREDVGQVMSRVPSARDSGFDFRFHPPATRGRLEIVARRRGKERGRIRSVYRTDLETAFPAPPPELVTRVTGSPNYRAFRTEGLRLATEFTDAVRRHRSEPIQRMLDWGCGCGRISLHLAADRVAAEHYGTDIDAEAVAWCAANIAGTFNPIPAEPPTHFPDAFFDVIIGYSVFTHLTEPMQQQWLRELRRITKPGGIVAVTVHGDYLGLFHQQCAAPSVQARLKSWLVGRLETIPGFVDFGPDPFLDGIAPPQYYRDVFQSRRYTEQEWAKHFDILEYVEGGQDLVVMRRPN